MSLSRCCRLKVLPRGSRPRAPTNARPPVPEQTRAACCSLPRGASTAPPAPGCVQQRRGRSSSQRTGSPWDWAPAWMSWAKMREPRPWTASTAFAQESVAPKKDQLPWSVPGTGTGTGKDRRPSLIEINIRGDLWSSSLTVKPHKPATALSGWPCRISWLQLHEPARRPAEPAADARPHAPSASDCCAVGLRPLPRGSAGLKFAPRECQPGWASRNCCSPLRSSVLIWSTSAR